VAAVGLAVKATRRYAGVGAVRRHGLQQMEQVQPCGGQGAVDRFFQFDGELSPQV
jgi:lipoate-protein ligase B